MRVTCTQSIGRARGTEIPHRNRFEICSEIFRHTLFSRSYVHNGYSGILTVGSFRIIFLIFHFFFFFVIKCGKQKYLKSLSSGTQLQLCYTLRNSIKPVKIKFTMKFISVIFAPAMMTFITNSISNTSQKHKKNILHYLQST